MMKKGERLTGNHQRQLEALNKLSTAILSNVDLEKIEKLLVQEVQSIFGGVGCMLFSPDGRGSLIAKAFSRVPGQDLEKQKTKIKDGLAGKVWKTRRPSYSNDIVGDRVFRGRPHPMALRLNVSKLLSVPLLLDGEPIGVLSVARTAQHPDFTDLDAELLAGFGNQAAIAIKNASTYQALKREQEALQESAERYRRVFEDSPMGLYRTTPDGGILMANPALLKMLGYSSLDELSKRNLEDSGYEPGYPRSMFVDLIETKGEVIGLDSAWIRADGSTLYVRENARAIRDYDGSILYYEGTVEDISGPKLLNEISTIVSSSLDLDEVLKNVMRETCKALGFQMAAVYLHNPTERRLELRSTYNTTKATAEKLKEVTFQVQQSLTGQCFKSGKVISYDKLSTGQRQRVHKLFYHQRLKALTCIPVMAREKRIGVLSLVSRKEVKLDPILERMASAIGNQVGMAIENASVHQDLKREKEALRKGNLELVEKEKGLQQSNLELKLLNQISKIVSGTLDLDKVLTRIMQESCRVLGFQTAGVFFHDPEEEALKCISTYNLSKAGISSFAGFPLPVNHSLAGVCLLTGRVLTHDKLRPEERKRVHEILSRLKVKSFVHIPVTAKGKKVAVVILTSLRDVRLEPSQVRLASAIGNQVGIAIENARLHDDACQKATELVEWNKRLSTLLEVSQAAVERTHLDGFLGKAAKLVAQSFGADGCSIVLVDDTRTIGIVRGLHPKGGGRFPPLGSKIKLADFPHLSMMCLEGKIGTFNLPDFKEASNSEHKHILRTGMKSAMGAPVRFGKVSLGAVTVWHAVPDRKYTQEEIDLLTSISNQVGIAIQNASTHQALREKHGALREGHRELLKKEKELLQSNIELRLLNEITNIVNSSLNLDWVLNSIMRESCKALGFQTAGIFLYNPERKRLEISSAFNAPKGMDEKLKKAHLFIQQGLAGQSFKLGKTLSYDKLGSEERKKARARFMDPQVRALTCIPVMAKGERIGVLALVSRKEVSSDPFLERMASAIGNQVGIAIENARLHENTRQQAKKLASWNKRLSTYLSISKAAAESTDLKCFLAQIVKLVAESFKADRCAVALLDETRKFAVVKAFHTKKVKPFPVIGERIELAKFPNLSAVCLQGEIRLLNPETFKKASPSEYEYTTKTKMKSGMFAPIECEREILGALCLYHAEDNRIYREEDTDFLAAIGNYVATAVRKYELAQEVEEKRKNLERLSSEIIHLQEKERKAVSAELHDGIGQSLSAMRINLDVIENSIPSVQEELRSRIRQSSKLLADTVEEIRHMGRNLRPRVLDDLGLVPALRSFTKDFSRQVSIPVGFSSRGDSERLTPDMKITIYRIVQEGLNNIAKHSKATEAWVSLHLRDNLCSLRIKDNGIGVDARKVLKSTDTRRTFGIFNIRERVALLGGEFEILSDKGKGVTLLVTIPVPEGEPDEQSQSPVSR